MSLKRFEILEMIAKGGMAEVYRAKTSGPQGFEKEVCVKKILPHLTEDEEFVTMFVNEAKLSATLNSANIVQVHDLCVSASGEYFIVMEYVRGKDLSEVIRTAQILGQRVPAPIAISVTREMCKGLQYAHTRTDSEGAPLNIIHRDISPHNVLVSFGGEVKLTDFGIAKASSIVNKTAVGILKGKYGYMSPEQARGHPVDARSDIFNAGIVLYELLVGERCFAGSSDFSTLNLMRNAQITLPSHLNAQIDRKLEAACLKALARERKDRFQTAAEFERTLGDVARDLRLEASSGEVATYVQKLFSSATPRGPANATGILDLASVVGPPPRPGGAREDAPRPKEATPASKPARASLRPARVPAAAGDTSIPPELGHALDPARPSGLAGTPDSKGAQGENNLEEPREGIAKRGPAGDQPPATKKPRAAGAAAKAAAAKDAPAVQADGSRIPEAVPPPKKRPVGRKDLRPGFTQIQALRRRGSGSFLLRASIVIVLAGGIGAMYGRMRTTQTARQDVLRAQELQDTPGSVDSLVTIFLTTEPPGATVRLDGLELASRTPISVLRERDTAAHEIVFHLDGYRPTRRAFEHGAENFLRLAERLEGESGELRVETEPIGVPVTVDGREVGVTPWAQRLAPGSYAVRLGGGAFEAHESTVRIEPARTVRLQRAVPRAGTAAHVRFVAPQPAEIWLNGEPTPWTTNGEPIPLAPQVDHRLAFRAFGRPFGANMRLRLAASEERTVYIEALE